MSDSDPISKCIKLNLIVSAGPRFGGKGAPIGYEWVVARRPTGEHRGWGETLGDAIDDLFARERAEAASSSGDDDLM